MGIEEDDIRIAMSEICEQLDGDAMASIGPVEKTSGGPAGDAIFPRSKPPTFVVFSEGSKGKFGFPDAVVYDSDLDLGDGTTVWLIDGAEDFKWVNGVSAGSIAAEALSKRREANCSALCATVVFDDSFEAHCANKWLPFGIHQVCAEPCWSTPPHPSQPPSSFACSV